MEIHPTNVAEKMKYGRPDSKYTYSRFSEGRGLGLVFQNRGHSSTFRIGTIKCLKPAKPLSTTIQPLHKDESIGWLLWCTHSRRTAKCNEYFRNRRSPLPQPPDLRLWVVRQPGNDLETRIRNQKGGTDSLAVYLGISAMNGGKIGYPCSESRNKMGQAQLKINPDNITLAITGKSQQISTKQNLLTNLFI